MRRTDRVRATLDAWLRDGGDLDTPGLKQALSSRTGAHTRTVERVLSEHRRVGGREDNEMSSGRRALAA